MTTCSCCCRIKYIGVSIEFSKEQFLGGQIMKKVILVSLCVLCLAGTSAFGYWVEGRVLDENGNGVDDANVYINCYSKSLSYTTTSGPLNGNAGCYAGGWLATNCKDENIVVKARKDNKSGTLSWKASSEAEVLKNVNISVPMFLTAELHCEAVPVAMSEPYNIESSTVVLYKQATFAGPILVNGGSVTMQYDTETMYCSSVEPNAPFGYNFSYNIVPASGTIYVNAYAPPSMYVPMQNGEHPTPFFTLKLAALNYSTPGKISNVQLTSSEIAIQSSGTKSAFPGRTEYVIGEPNAKCNPYRRIVSQQDWEEALSSGHVYAMEPQDWEGYMSQWQTYKEEGPDYPDSNFLQARPPEGQLYVYGGGGGGGAYDPCAAGLVMGWGYEGMPLGSYCSAWKFDYLKDPDLSNCIISIVVTAPKSDVNGVQINQVSLGLQNAPVPGGPIRSWYWNCGAAGSGAPITWGVPTQIRIDTTKVGVAAATPVATAYASNPAFNLQNVQWLIVDENGNWLGGSPPPAPGGFQFLWNYWYWLMISPKTTLSKDYYKKWSQPPVVLDANNPPVFIGWDELSDYNMVKIVADDWQCKDDRPITDIHWWGSFIGWNEPYPPPVVPKAFHIGIWTDVPDPDPGDPLTFSHPGTLIWQNYCDNFVWNFAGYDSDPRVFHDPCAPYEPTEACFQYNQLLSQDEWFHQEPTSDPNGRVYWVSISAVWPAGTKPYQWGWKTRPHNWNDDAAETNQFNPAGKPSLGSVWVNGNPITYPLYPDPHGVSFDMAFELTTNEPAYADNPIPGDLNGDKIVNFFDFAIMANNWLVSVP
jgi:hypothetical protein